MHWYRKINNVWEEMALPADSDAAQLIAKRMNRSVNQESIVISENEFIAVHDDCSHVYHYKRF